MMAARRAHWILIAVGLLAIGVSPALAQEHPGSELHLGLVLPEWVRAHLALALSPQTEAAPSTESGCADTRR